MVLRYYLLESQSFHPKVDSALPLSLSPQFFAGVLRPNSKNNSRPSSFSPLLWSKIDILFAIFLVNPIPLLPLLLFLMGVAVNPRLPLVIRANCVCRVCVCHTWAFHSCTHHQATTTCLANWAAKTQIVHFGRPWQLASVNREPVNITWKGWWWDRCPIKSQGENSLVKMKPQSCLLFCFIDLGVAGKWEKRWVGISTSSRSFLLFS